jgi:gas vesicle protein
MQVAELELYDILKSKLGDKEARTLVEYIEARVERKFEEKKDLLATKDDISRLKDELKDDISRLKDELKGDISSLKNELKGDISSLKNELKGDISSLKNELKGDISSLRDEFKKDLLATKDDISSLKVEIAQVRTEIQHSRADIIKWMFLFWVGQVATLIAILQIFFRK